MTESETREFWQNLQDAAQDTGDIESLQTLAAGERAQRNLSLIRAQSAMLEGTHSRALADYLPHLAALRDFPSRPAQ